MVDLKLHSSIFFMITMDQATNYKMVVIKPAENDHLMQQLPSRSQGFVFLHLLVRRCCFLAPNSTFIRFVSNCSPKKKCLRQKRDKEEMTMMNWVDKDTLKCCVVRFFCSFFK